MIHNFWGLKSEYIMTAISLILLSFIFGLRFNSLTLLEVNDIYFYNNRYLLMVDKKSKTNKNKNTLLHSLNLSHVP